MNLKSLDQLNRIEAKLTEIREILNPEDSPYICDTIVTNIADEELENLVKDMMLRMGYKNKLIEKTLKIIREIQK
ncbi:MAG: hypothetical protein NT116_05605 [Candidatus Parcubacteria bacterium]|nr:hypothetical protein [Candidatus Parcubacteria bacterium]